MIVAKKHLQREVDLAVLVAVRWRCDRCAGLVFIPHVLALAIALHVMIASCVRIVKSMLAVQLL